MTEAEKAFNSIAEKMSAEFVDVDRGPMMSSPGIRKKGRVIAFFYENKMVFKLGKHRDLESEFGIKRFEYLSPFKNKPPMKGWFIIDVDYISLWSDLASEAYETM